MHAKGECIFTSAAWEASSASHVHCLLLDRQYAMQCICFINFHQTTLSTLHQALDINGALFLSLQVRVTPLTTKKFDHQGIKVQLLGVIELASERGVAHDFVSLGTSMILHQHQSWLHVLRFQGILGSVVCFQSQGNVRKCHGVGTVLHVSMLFDILPQLMLMANADAPHVHAVRELAPPGDLNNIKTFPFEFKSVEMQYDSYRGQQVRCR